MCLDNPMSITAIGARVVAPCGDVGHIEEADPDGLVRVRLLTPHNTPSCCSSWCDPAELKDGTNVLPQPRSKAWYAESRAFCGEVVAALQDAGI